MAQTTPADLKLLSLDFEKKLLVFQLEQERAKTARASAAPTDLQEKVEQLKLQLKEKERIITHLTNLSVHHETENPTLPSTTNINNNNNNDIEFPSQCMTASDMARRIKNLEQQLASCMKEKEKIADQLQISASEKHNYLSLNFRLTMERQSWQGEKDKLNEEIQLQKSTQENNLKELNDLQDKFNSVKSEQKKLSDENRQLKKELDITNQTFQKAKEIFRKDQKEYDVKFKNLNENLKSKTSQLNHQEQIVTQLRTDLKNCEIGGKFKSVCNDIQELGKNMQLLLDSQTEEKDRKISELKRQLKDFKLCSICYEEMESNGNHRSVSLPCGHLFGSSCLKLCLQQAQNCPNCRVSSNSGSLRYIFLN